MNATLSDHFLEEYLPLSVTLTLYHQNKVWLLLKFCQLVHDATPQTKQPPLSFFLPSFALPLPIPST